MKRIFSINRRVIEILVTLLLVFMAAGYYYLIYIPAREDEIIARRFRTLQRIERNIKEKFQAYIATVGNCISRSSDPAFKQLVEQYNSDKDKFSIRIVNTETLEKKGSRLGKSGIPVYDSAISAISEASAILVKPESNKNLRKITLSANSYILQKDSTIIHTELEALIDYREFVSPLLQQNVFDQYIVFNVNKDTSSVVYESFPSGISFNNIDSLFDAREKVYSSRVVHIETAGQKYLAFLHPSGYARKNDRIIVGLYREDLFNREKQKLPEKMVTSILFIALFAFLLLPFLRLVVMGKKDRLRVYDVAAVYFCFILLVPTIVLVLLWNKNRFQDANENGVAARKELAKKISENFAWELEKSYRMINNLDQLYSVNQRIKILDEYKIAHLVDSLKKYKIKVSPSGRDSVIFDSLNTLIRSDSYRRNVDYAFWMDSSGREVANWSFDKNPPPGNYKDRQYFRDALNEKLLPVPGHNSEVFAIEPHISRVDGKFKIAMAKKSKSNRLVVAAPSLFHSLTNPILPLGFTFSITDGSGNTIFDSDTTNNLNENLLEELSDASPFKTVIQTKVPREFESRYKEQEYIVWTEPIKGFPWFISIFENKAFVSSVNAQSFSFTMLMMFLVFLLLFFEIIIVFAASSKYSRLLRSKVDLVWIHPRKSRANEYRFLAFFNVILIFYLWIYCLTSFSVQRVTEYTFLIALSPLVTAISILHYKAAPGDESKKYSKHSVALGILVIIVALLLFAASRYGENIFSGSWKFVAFSVVTYWLLNRLNKLKSDDNYLPAYKLMIFSRVFLSTVLPVILCFKCISIFEHRLQERLRLLDLAKKIEAGTKNKSQFDLFIANPQRNSITACYSDLDWVHDLHNQNETDTLATTSISAVDSINAVLLKASRIHNNNIASIVTNLDLVKHENDAGLLFNNIFSHEPSSLEYTMEKTDSSGAHAVRIYLSSFGRYNCVIPDLKVVSKEIIFWLLFIGIMALCYQVLGFAIQKLFACQINEVEPKIDPSFALMDDKGPSFVFVQGVIGIGSNKLLREMLAFKNKWKFFKEGLNWYDAVVMDLNDVTLFRKGPGVFASQRKEPTIQIKAPQPQSTQTTTDTYTKIENPYPLVSKSSVLEDPLVKCVLFTQFEFNSISMAANPNMLKLLEKLVLEGHKKIIISSAINPNAFVTSIQKNICGEEKKESPKESSKQEMENGNLGNLEAECPEVIHRWKYLLGKFVTFELQDVVKSMSGEDPKEYNNSKCFNEQYISEISSLGLKKEDASGSGEEEILRGQKLFRQPYLSLWDSLTSEEQLLLVDLAEDGLVNTLNVLVLEGLIDRGLVYWDDNVLYIVNASFRNFILTTTNSGELKHIQKEIGDGQSWSDYKYPVLIALGALVYFVLTSNPEKFGNILPFISGIMAGIPTIIKILSYIKPSAGKA